MTPFDPTTLLDPPRLEASTLARIERQVGALLGIGTGGSAGAPVREGSASTGDPAAPSTSAGTDDPSTVVLFQAEAILALEAVATALAAPGRHTVNVATGPYGVIFGDWMRRAGAEVVDVVSDLDSVATVEQVVAALDAHPQTTVLAVAHAEAATGGSNPVAEIVRAARERGVVTVVDAVASVGAEPVEPVAWGADVCVIGPQKALAGPAGVSVASISPRAWDLVETHPDALRSSSLSLLDWRDGWLRTDRSVIPGTPSVLETLALGAALDRVQAEGLDAVVARHAAAAARARAGVVALGLRPWQRDPQGYAAVVTTVAVPEDAGGGAFARAAVDAGGGLVGHGSGPLAGRLVRINHTGRDATPEAVDQALFALAEALRAVRAAGVRTRD